MRSVVARLQVLSAVSFAAVMLCACPRPSNHLTVVARALEPEAPGQQPLQIILRQNVEQGLRLNPELVDPRLAEQYRIRLVMPDTSREYTMRLHRDSIGQYRMPMLGDPRAKRKSAH